MDRVTIALRNIARYKRLIATETNEVVREMTQRLIAEEQAVLAKNVRDTALAQVARSAVRDETGLAGYG